MERRIFRGMCVTVAVVVGLSPFLAPWRVTTGLLLGGLLSLFNHHWLRTSVGAVFGSTAAGARPKLMAARYVLRYVVIAAVVYAAYRLGVVSLPAVLVGMCSFVVAALVEGFMQLYLAVFHRRGNRLMFFLFNSDPAATPAAAQHAAEGAHAATEAGGHGAAAEAAHHTPAIVEAVNHYVGHPIYDFQMHYTKPIWDKFFANFGTTAEKVFAASPYSPDNAVPWYTVMFLIACVLSVIVIIFMKRGLSEDEPSNRQQTLEAGVLAVRSLLYDNVGPHGLKYFPVVATFGVLILISNLMGLIPGLMSPTASTSVTFAFGISSFVYYNWIGIKENGLGGHLRHFAGPILWLAPLMFPVELISNFVRPISLGVRLFGNIFSDEQVMMTISGLTSGLLKAPWVLPVLLMPLSVFVAFMQTFIFVLLSMIYIGEVTHSAHDEHDPHDTHGENIIAPALT